MSDPIKHECGIAMIRLLKPLDYYLEKYGTAFYGMNKLYLLMEKQHNRGQDGTGIANVKLNCNPGTRYISRTRSNDANPIQDVFARATSRITALEQEDPEKLKDIEWLQENMPYTGEVFLGHLRYGTYGGNSIERCHPFLKQSNWRSRSLLVAGNFNLTNVDELFNKLLELGQHPKEKADTVTVMEKIGHFLDVHNNNLHREYKKQGHSNQEISSLIAENLDLPTILSQSSAKWDGGYAMAGILGHGDSFVMRDPAGVRPAFYYHNDEVAVVTSERPTIQTAFNVPAEDIHEIPPGSAFIVKRNGSVNIHQILEPLEKKPCSFERIYFSRGSDKDIYQERKMLGRLLTPAVLKSVENDIENTVFSFIPNTAETSYYGMVQGVADHCNEIKKQRLLEADKLTPEIIDGILAFRPRFEKIAIKDAKMRTFITNDNSRDDLVAHVYDITYGSIKPHRDNLVIIDDSIVRGTTLRQSIIRILDRLNPKKIVIVSSAPQIRYPDCYGIDMAKMGDFIAFQAAISLLKKRGQQHIIDSVYRRCKEQESAPKEDIINYVKEIYQPFTAQEISEEISKLLTPVGTNAEVEIIYQSIEQLHEACPNHKGDWYFTGDYPTPGGNQVVNKAFIYYIEGRDIRAY